MTQIVGSGSNVTLVLANTNNLYAGMNVDGEGIVNGTTIVSVDSAIQITINNKATVVANTMLTFTSPYNFFYGTQYDSSLKILLNQGPEVVKGFSTLKYEGSQAKVTLDAPATATELALGISLESHDGSLPPSEVGQYYNNIAKYGWYVNSIKTNLQEGQSLEFKDKEGKWFNYIKGEKRTVFNETGDRNTNQYLDTSEFSLQGIAYAPYDIDGDFDEKVELTVKVVDCQGNKFIDYPGENYTCCGTTLTGIINNSHLCGDIDDTVWFSAHTENIPADTDGIITTQTLNDTVNNGSVVKEKKFHLSPPPGKYISAESFILCGGEQSTETSFGVGSCWYFTGTCTGISENCDKIECVTFQDTTSPWAPDNKVLVTVKLHNWYTFDGTDTTIEAPICGKAFDNPPNTTLHFTTVHNGSNPIVPSPCTSGLDVCFLFDYTGGDSTNGYNNNQLYIQSVQNVASDIITKVDNLVGSGNYRLGIGLCDHIAEAHQNHKPCHSDHSYPSFRFDTGQTYQNPVWTHTTGTFQAFSKRETMGLSNGSCGSTSCGGYKQVAAAWYSFNGGAKGQTNYNNGADWKTYLDYLAHDDATVTGNNMVMGLCNGPNSSTSPWDYAIRQLYGLAGGWQAPTPLLGINWIPDGHKQVLVLSTDNFPSGSAGGVCGGDDCYDCGSGGTQDYLDMLVADMASAGIVVYAFGDGANLGYSCNSGFIYPIQKMTTDLANGSTYKFGAFDITHFEAWLDGLCA